MVWETPQGAVKGTAGYLGPEVRGEIKPEDKFGVHQVKVFQSMGTDEVTQAEGWSKKRGNQGTPKSHEPGSPRSLVSQTRLLPASSKPIGLKEGPVDWKRHQNGGRRMQGVIRGSGPWESRGTS